MASMSCLFCNKVESTIIELKSEIALNYCVGFIVALQRRLGFVTPTNLKAD